MNFEESNERLQEIIKLLDKNDLKIDEATKLYEEAVMLAKNCSKILSDCKGKVTILKNELDSVSSSSTEEE